MPSRDDLKRSVSDEIDRKGEELIRIAKTILVDPVTYGMRAGQAL